jgi:uncharacterized protein (DUF2236 family)
MIYEITMGKMSAATATRFYEESKTAGQLLGVPKDLIPIDLAAFRIYFDTVITDGTLYLSDYGVATGRAIIEHKHAPTRVVKYLASGMLPDYLCAGWTINHTVEAERSVTRLLRRLGWWYRLLPRGLRAAPAYHQAQLRVARAGGKASTTLLGRFWWSIAKRWKRFPLTIPTE